MLCMHHRVPRVDLGQGEPWPLVAVRKGGKSGVMQTPLGFSADETIGVVPSPVLWAYLVGP